MLVTNRPFRERDLRLRGLKFRICGWGPEEGPIVLILHGWLDQGAAWNRVACRLASNGMRVIAPDQRGHGCTDHTPQSTSYHFAEYLADLDSIYEWIAEPVSILVGHSMGGTVASLYAGLRSKLVERLVLVEGVGPPSESTGMAVDRLQTWLDHQNQVWTSPRMENVEAAAKRLCRFNPALPFDEACMLAERSTMEEHGARVWRWDPRHRSRSAIAYDVARHRECMSRIEANVWFVQGDKSWYLGIPDLEERLASIPRLRQIQLSGGHALHIDSPVELADVLLGVSAQSSL